MAAALFFGLRYIGRGSGQGQSGMSIHAAVNANHFEGVVFPSGKQFLTWSRFETGKQPKFAFGHV